MKRRRSVRYYSVAMLAWFIACIVLIGMAIYESVQQVRLVSCGVRTDATVIQKAQRRGEVSTYSFTTDGGIVMNVKGITGAGRVGLKIGDVVPIIYLPANPKIVATQGFRGFTFLFLILATMAFVGLAFVSALWGYEETKMPQHPSYFPSSGKRA